MKVIQSRLENGYFLVDAEATAKEVTEAFNKAQILFANKMGLTPEPGKTPAQAAQEQLGIRDLDAIVNADVVEYLWPIAIEQRNLQPAFPPHPVSQDILRRGKSYRFQFEVCTKPKFELSSYEPLTLEAPAFEPDLSGVETTIDEIASHYMEFVTVSDIDRPVQNDDTILLSMESKLVADGEILKNLTFKSRPYTAGQGYMPEEFESHIIGMKVGETKTFTFGAPTLDGAGKPVSEDVECTVTVIEFQTSKKPEVNDEWVRKFLPGYTSREALVKDIEKGFVEEQRFAHDAALRTLASEKIAERFEGSFANDVLLSMRDGLMESLRTSLRSQGKDYNEYVQEMGGEEQLNIMMLIEARKTLSEGYALDAVYRHFKLYTTDDDIVAVCRSMNPQNPMAVRQSMEAGGRGFALRESAERYKAAKYLVEHATIETVDADEE